uniref:Uncharacterized protein n=1 Tax=Arion vulgaris TaxID=1028688 RepID=A0A0B6Z267_9EUPU
MIYEDLQMEQYVITNENLHVDKYDRRFESELIHLIIKITFCRNHNYKAYEIFQQSGHL